MAEMKIVDFEPNHLAKVKLQLGQRGFAARAADPVFAADLKKSGPAWSAIRGDDVLGCAGFQEMWEGRAICWALFSEGIGQDFIKIHRRVRAELKKGRYRRVEALVTPSLFRQENKWELPHFFWQGHLWATQLGFIVETPCAKNYLQDGTAVTIYVWLGE